MSNVADYETSPDPIKRAIYWLVHLSWNNPDDFETLQELAGGLEAMTSGVAAVGLPLSAGSAQEGGQP